MEEKTNKLFLDINKEDFLKGLSERISAGEDILNYEYYDAYHLALLILSYERWDKENLNVLNSLFVNKENEFLGEYNFLRLNEYIFSLSDEKQISIYIDYIKRKIDLLNEIQKQLVRF